MFHCRLHRTIQTHQTTIPRQPSVKRSKSNCESETVKTIQLNSHLNCHESEKILLKIVNYLGKLTNNRDRRKKEIFHLKFKRNFPGKHFMRLFRESDDEFMIK
jgi:hypothetical protein